LTIVVHRGAEIDMNKTNIPVQANGTNTPFPSEDINPELKNTKEYGLIVARAIYYTSAQYGPRLFYNNRSIADEYVDYAIGNQSEDQYKPLLKIEPKQGDVTWVGALRWAIKNYATKRVNIAVSKISERMYDPSVEVLDQNAINAKEDARNRVKFFMKYNQEIQGIQSITRNKYIPDEIANELMPQNEDELDIIMQNYKIREAIILEKGIAHHMERQRFANIKRRTAFNTFVKGAQALFVGMDANMLPEIYNCDPSDMILPSTEREDFSDIGYAAHVQTPTVPEFYKMVGDSLSPAEIADIVKRHAKTDLIYGYSRDGSNRTGHQGDQARIPVMRYAYKSQNEMVHISRKDSNGNQRLWKQDFEAYRTPKEQEKFKEKYGDSRKLIRSRYFSIYGGFWVVGSETVFRHGEMHNQERSRGNLAETALPFKIFAPNIQNNQLVSTMKQMIPVLNELQEYHVKKQHVLANAIPAVWSIDLKAMRDAQFQWNNKDMTDQQKIMFLFQTGIFVYDSGDRYKSGSSYQPIKNMANSVANEVMMYVSLVNNALQELDEIIGFNRVTSASTLRPDTLKGTAEIQENSSEVALDYLYRADREMTLEVIKSLGILTRQSIKYKTDSYYERIFSKSDIQIMKASKFGDMGFSAQLRPTQKEWNDLYGEMLGSIEKGEIGYDDYMDFKLVNNLKEARNLFKARIRRRKREAQQMDMEKIQGTGQVQAQSNDQAHQNKMREIDESKAIEAAKMAHEKELEKIRHKNKMAQIRQLQQLKTAGDMLVAGEKDESEQGKFIAEKLMDEFLKEDNEAVTKKTA
jgi:hypothetical protein